MQLLWQLTTGLLLQSESLIPQLVSNMGIRLIIDLVALFILIRFIYFPIYKHRELFLTFYIFNLVIFLMSYLLNKAELSMGAAFGLFAVFGMLRYKTEELSIKDMTYLFMVIAMGLITAIARIDQVLPGYEYLFLILINLLIIVAVFVVEHSWMVKKEGSKIIVYDNLDLIHADKKQLLIDDLISKTGISVTRISILKIDFQKKAAQIKIYYSQE